MRLRTVLEAEAELRESAAWYEKQRRGLGLEFLVAADLAVQAIRRSPERFARVETLPEETSVRRLLMDRFPYQIIFEVTEKEIRILAIAHTSRKPNYWQSRR